MTLQTLNQLSPQDAYATFEACCCAPNWVTGMVAARPFDSPVAMYKAAEDLWLSLGEADYLAAFEGHPQIGDVSTLREKYRNTAGSAGHEQAGMNQASEETLQRMMILNQDYLSRFGFIFIVCASGKSADEMLAIIESRITNDPATELAIAANEQSKITQLRLEKLL